MTPPSPLEPDQSSQPPSEAEESQLCISCMFPNAPAAHFCTQCGAPLSPYASTGPFERLFAEGAVYRQAAQRPKSLFVVLGVWFIFGTMALGGRGMIAVGKTVDLRFMPVGAFIVTISVALIWKTTRNYLARNKSGEKREG